MFSITFSQIQKSLKILALPFLQLLALRYFLHAVLNLRFGFAYFTDYDFIFPVPIAFIFLLHVIEREERITLMLNQALALANAAFMVAFMALNVWIEPISAFSPLLFTGSWFLLLALIVASSLFLFLDSKAVLKARYLFPFLLTLMLASSLYFYNHYIPYVWDFMGVVTSKVIFWVFNFVELSMIKTKFDMNRELMLVHPYFVVKIAKGCGGGDGLFYFTLTFLFYKLYFDRSINGMRSVGIYAVGLLAMVMVNVVRIIFFYLLGIYFMQVLPSKAAVGLFMMLFHSNVGWLLYFTFGLFYFRLVYKLSGKVSIRLSPPRRPITES